MLYHESQSDIFFVKMKETFIVRTEWMDSILELAPEDQATIFRNLFHFHAEEFNLINLNNLSVKLVWKLIEPNLKRNIDAYDKRSETSAANGRKGGRKKVGYSESLDKPDNIEKKEPNPNLIQEPNKPIEPIESLSVSDSVSVLVSDIDIKEKENSFLNLENQSSQSSQILEKEKSSAKKENVDWMGIFPFKSDEARKAVNDYSEHRKQLKVKKYTEIGWKQACKEWEAWGEAVFIEAVYKAIANNWQGIFHPVKQSNNNSNGNNNQRTNGRIEPAPHGAEFGKFGANQ